jgi:hypothetical protein
MAALAQRFNRRIFEATFMWVSAVQRQNQNKTAAAVFWG